MASAGIVTVTSWCPVAAWVVHAPVASGRYEVSSTVTRTVDASTPLLEVDPWTSPVTKVDPASGRVPPGGSASGAIAQIERAFRTQMHRYRVDGAAHLAMGRDATARWTAV